MSSPHPQHASRDAGEDTTLMSLRTTVIMIGSLLVGATSAALTYAAFADLALAGIALGTAFGGAVFFFEKLISRRV